MRFRPMIGLRRSSNRATAVAGFGLAALIAGFAAAKSGSAGLFIAAAVTIAAAAAAAVSRRDARREIRRLTGDFERRVLTQTIELYERTAMYEDANRRLAAESAERKSAEDEARRALQRLEALRAIEVAVGSSLDLKKTLDVWLENIEQLFPFRTAMTVRLVNAVTGELEALACRNIDAAEWKKSAPMAFMPFSREVITARAPRIVRDMRSDPRMRKAEFYLSHGFVSAAKFPLIAHGEALGILAVFTARVHDFTDDEIEFLTTLSDQAAVAIRHSQLYERSKRHGEELARVNRAKNEFLSVMSHELRTPLNVMMGYASLLKLKSYGEVTKKMAEVLDKIIHNGNQQLAMIDRILQVTQIAAGRMPVLKRDVDMDIFFDNLKTAASVPEGKPIVLKWRYPRHLVVETDGDNLKHIVVNLIDNAIKFSDKGAVEIAAAYDRGCLTLTVADTGIGIAPEKMPHIFDMFSQVDRAETRTHGGAGIGLYIVKNLTERLGGTVAVASEIGKGSTFTVQIPAQRDLKRLSA